MSTPPALFRTGCEISTDDGRQRNDHHGAWTSPRNATRLLGEGSVGEQVRSGGGAGGPIWQTRAATGSRCRKLRRGFEPVRHAGGGHPFRRVRLNMSATSKNDRHSIRLTVFPCTTLHDLCTGLLLIDGGHTLRHGIHSCWYVGNRFM